MTTEMNAPAAEPRDPPPVSTPTGPGRRGSKRRRKDVPFSRWVRTGSAKLLKHSILLFVALLSTVPIAIVVMNSFKERRAIFDDPYSFPNSDTFDPVGYETVFRESEFELYYFNSIFVTVVSLFFILLLSSMASFALSEYEFRGSTLVTVFLLLGLMVPIRLASVSIVRIILDLGLINTLWALIIVYVAGGVPLATFILTSFMRQVPRSMKDAARMDGASEYRVLWLVIPIVRPGLGTVAALSIIPIWNDLWWPLILAPGDSTRTVTLGAQQFFGQFSNDWNAVLASLTLSTVPVLIAYFIASRQLLRGLTAGAIKS